MAEALNLKPGDTVELSCRDASTPQLKKGDLIGSDFIVIDVNGSAVSLGPLKAGDLLARFNCSNQSTIEQAFKIQALKKEELPDRSAPVMPWKLHYPTWVFVLAGAFVLSLILGYLYYQIRRGKKGTQNMAREVEVVPPMVQLGQFLRSAPKMAENEARLEELYSKANDLLRSSLEERFAFQAKWQTSSEFVGTLRSTLLGAGPLREITPDIESLISQADQVRFSKEKPPVENRKSFVKTLEGVFRKISAAPSASPSGSQAGSRSGPQSAPRTKGRR